MLARKPQEPVDMRSWRRRRVIRKRWVAYVSFRVGVVLFTAATILGAINVDRWANAVRVLGLAGLVAVAIGLAANER